MVYTGLPNALCVEFDKDVMEILRMELPLEVYERPFKLPTMISRDSLVISGSFIRKATGVYVLNENTKFHLPFEAFKVFESYK